jgi:hypothetical protein
MRFLFLSLACICAVYLCWCYRSPATPGYAAGQAPLTADELAQLLGVDHWKISALPKSDTPYWGVRVVARRADDSVVRVSTPQQFGTSITADGNNAILVGTRRETDGFSGTLMLGTRPKAISLTRFTFPHSYARDSGLETSNGLSWKGDRAELIRCVDEKQQTTFSICVELLHGQPK